MISPYQDDGSRHDCGVPIPPSPAPSRRNLGPLYRWIQSPRRSDLECLLLAGSTSICRGERGSSTRTHMWGRDSHHPTFPREVRARGSQPIGGPAFRTATRTAHLRRQPSPHSHHRTLGCPTPSSLLLSYPAAIHSASATDRHLRLTCLFSLPSPTHPPVPAFNSLNRPPSALKQKHHGRQAALLLGRGRARDEEGSVHCHPRQGVQHDKLRRRASVRLSSLFPLSWAAPTWLERPRTAAAHTRGGRRRWSWRHGWLTCCSGGEEVLLDVGGQDATEAFEDVGHSDEAREILDGLLVGTLDRKVCGIYTSVPLHYEHPPIHRLRTIRTAHAFLHPGNLFFCHIRVIRGGCLFTSTESTPRSRNPELTPHPQCSEQFRWGPGHAEAFHSCLFTSLHKHHRPFPFHFTPHTSHLPPIPHPKQINTTSSPNLPPRRATPSPKPTPRPTPPSPPRTTPPQASACTPSSSSARDSRSVRINTCRRSRAARLRFRAERNELVSWKI